jgi:hypothetical protein
MCRHVASLVAGNFTESHRFIVCCGSVVPGMVPGTGIDTRYRSWPVIYIITVVPVQ